ncbi:MAG: hypothetical protein AAGU76_02710 [Sedimentibacter sp.]|uniref:hypothetical protein n=1 Tax=Sedimentibacter sp. TaxID=1960295 RepID=UPI0031580077
MLKQVYDIDEFGYLKEIKVAEFDEQGNCLDEHAENIITTDIPQGLYRKKWTGTEWIEDMPQEEIDALNNQPKEPTENEQLRADVDYIAIMTGVEL